MRLWHIDLLPYLPELQFKGQLRELVAIMHDWRDKGKTNHLLINKVMEYEKDELTRYFYIYGKEYRNRYDTFPQKQWEKLRSFAGYGPPFFECNIFENWHNKEYLRVCMANLYEKHFFGVGKSRITDEEWETLCRGYKEITGEEYVI